MKTDKKLSAFLHDTVDKPLILMTGHERHESRAKKIADILGISINEDDFRGADWIASAMDRLLMPRIGKNNPGFQVKFTESPKIIHPTSGDAMELGLSFSLAEVDSAVTMSFQRISEMGLSKESLYHYLWRKIRDELKGNSGRQWRKIWDILPADTRVPDHTIWDHLKVTCLCSAASYTDSNRLYNRLGTFIFTIGPVQSFIQNARKTQDLWMGSYILSYLNWMAIKSVIEEHGPDCVIYPDLYLQPMVDHWLHNDKGIEIDNINSIDMLTPTIPNRFLAILPIDDIEEIGRKAEDAVRSEFRRMAEFVFDEFFSDWRNTYAREMLDSQIDNFLDIFWVGTPWYSSDEKAPDWQNAISNLKSYVPQKSSDYGEFLIFLSKKGEYPPNIGTLYGLLHCISERSLG